jgi:hypothetical protein
MNGSLNDGRGCAIAELWRGATAYRCRSLCMHSGHSRMVTPCFEKSRRVNQLRQNLYRLRRWHDAINFTNLASCLCYNLTLQQGEYSSQEVNNFIITAWLPVELHDCLTCLPSCTWSRIQMRESPGGLVSSCGAQQQCYPRDRR